MHITGVAQLPELTSQKIEKDSPTNRLSNLLLFLKSVTFPEMAGNGCIVNNMVKMLVNMAYSHHGTALKN